MSEMAATSAATSAAPSGLAAVQGVVFDVQRYSLHDGPGVRTNIFLKGCPLRCPWCANPESQTRQPEPMLRKSQCIDCGLFAAENEASAGSNASSCTACWPAWQQAQGNGSIRADIDARISGRVAICPTGALSWAGSWRTAGEVLAEVLRDRMFYGAGGGLTLTGGEPTMQPDFCQALLVLAQDAGLTTAMETCGHTPWVVLERLLPYLDVVLFDVKHIDAERHRQTTGMDNALILENLRRISAAGSQVRVRVPLIPGFNATTGDVAAIAAFVRGLPRPVQGVDLLPYHSMGKAKYAALGREYPWLNHKRLSDAAVQELASTVTAYGLSVTVGG